MQRTRTALFALAFAVAAPVVQAQQSQTQPAKVSPASGSSKIINTVKQKLAAGKKVVGGTVSIPDPDVYCAMANSGFDFTWIEMQHSTLNYTDVARMVWACRDAPAMPFIRVPDATEGDIQKATDLGALGIIIPMVDTVDKVKNAIKFAKYPPLGARSQGSGQHASIWGRDYRQIANDNIMIVAMIENPAGVKIVDQLAALEGVDVIFVAATDLSSFSGMRQGDPGYEALVKTVFESVHKHKKFLAGPLAWKNTREGYSFFQGPGETALLRTGAKMSLTGAMTEGEKKGVAVLEGTETVK